MLPCLCWSASSYAVAVRDEERDIVDASSFVCMRERADTHKQAGKRGSHDMRCAKFTAAKPRTRQPRRSSSSSDPSEVVAALRSSPRIQVIPVACWTSLQSHTYLAELKYYLFLYGNHFLGLQTSQPPIKQGFFRRRRECTDYLRVRWRWVVASCALRSC